MSMKYMGPLLALLALAGGAAWLLMASAASPLVAETRPPGQTVLISLTEEGFVPNDISIRQGDTVVFSTELSGPFWPASDFHPTHGIYPAFDPGRPMQPEETWSFTFDKAGAWRYHDHLSPKYHGTIHVEA